jgi:hypothetical protein
MAPIQHCCTVRQPVCEQAATEGPVQDGASGPGASAAAGSVQRRSRVRQAVRERSAVACVGVVAAAGVDKL